MPIQIPDELPQAVRRQSNAVEIQPQNVAALQQRRGSQVGRNFLNVPIFRQNFDC